MTRVDQYPQGAPAWVDLQSPDPEVSKRFYTELFGWQYQDNAMSADYTYSMALVDGAAVAAIAPQTAEAVQTGIPTAWNTYFAVDDLDAVLEKVAPAGGRVLLPADRVADFGRMAQVEDSIGAPFALWQAERHPGAALVNEPGAFAWHELAAGDWRYAVPFYEEVFGGESVEDQIAGGDYTMLKVGGQLVAGFIAPDEDTKPHWETYFGVSDVDAVIEAARQTGGEMLTEPFEAEGIGRMAKLCDPHGGVFWIMRQAGSGS